MTRLIITSLSDKAEKEIVEFNNGVCKENYKVNKINDAWREELNSKLDTTVDDPVFSLEIPGYQTIDGSPAILELSGLEYFNTTTEIE